MYRGVACHSKPAMPEPECTAETFPSGFTIASGPKPKMYRPPSIAIKRVGNDDKIFNQLRINVDGAPITDDSVRAARRSEGVQHPEASQQASHFDMKRVLPELCVVGGFHDDV